MGTIQLLPESSASSIISFFYLIVCVCVCIQFSCSFLDNIFLLISSSCSFLYFSLTFFFFYLFSIFFSWLIFILFSPVATKMSACLLAFAQFRNGVRLEGTDDTDTVSDAFSPITLVSNCLPGVGCFNQTDKAVFFSRRNRNRRSMASFFHPFPVIFIYFYFIYLFIYFFFFLGKGLLGDLFRSDTYIWLHCDFNF